MFQYSVYQKNDTRVQHEGAAISIKKELKSAIIDAYEENSLSTTAVSTSLVPICIAMGYRLLRRPMTTMQNMLHIFRQQMSVYFVGDLNGKHCILGHGNENKAGNTLETVLFCTTAQIFKHTKHPEYAVLLT